MATRLVRPAPAAAEAKSNRDTASLNLIRTWGNLTGEFGERYKKAVARGASIPESSTSLAITNQR
jgi:hypothetical protein